MKFREDSSVDGRVTFEVQGEPKDGDLNHIREAIERNIAITEDKLSLFLAVKALEKVEMLKATAISDGTLQTIPKVYIQEHAIVSCARNRIHHLAGDEALGLLAELQDNKITFYFTAENKESRLGLARAVLTANEDKSAI